ncbi:galactose oxidase [Microdochium nivale]|nr:galactose oxidase [Microdochium nivale]
MALFKATAVAALLLAQTTLGQQQQQQQPLTRLAHCPSGEQRLGTPSGSLYATCSQADFRGDTTQTLTNVATLSDCAQACERQAGCSRAVYDAVKVECHLKSSTCGDRSLVPADAAAGLTTIKWLHTFRAGEEIGFCASATGRNVTTAEGVAMTTCANAQYLGTEEGETVEGVVSLDDCAAECGRSVACKRAVYHGETKQCVILADGGEDVLCTFQPGYDTVCKETPGAGEEVPPVSTTPEQPPVATESAPVESTPVTPEPTESTSVRPTPTESTPLESTPIESTPVESTPASSAPVEPTPTATLPADPVSLQGRWSDLLEFPIIPVAAYMVPSAPGGVANKLLMFSSWGERAFGGAGGKTQFAEYDMDTGAISQRLVADTHHDMFCPGISALSDGRIVITGGSDAAAVSIYDPATNDFARAPDMSIARGYQTSATLSDGKIFTIGGSYSGGRGGKTGEVFDPNANAWTMLDGTDPAPLLTHDREGIWREDNHAWLYGWRNGSVFQAGPSRAMNWYLTGDAVGPEGGAHVAAGDRGSSMDQMCGVNVMYDVGKILSAGGSQDYTNSPATAEAHVITIPDDIGGEATSVATASMKYARGFANAVVLPDGQVVVTGGQKRSAVFTDTDSVLEPESWSAATGKWTLLAPAQVPRNYHSVSILLPDGTIFVGGGGMCYGQKNCDLAKDHLDGEIFSPPYLFARDGKPAARPVVSRISATEGVQVGRSIVVDLEEAAASEGVTFVLVRMGSVTHSINSDQRRVPITEARQVAPGKHEIVIPNDSGVVLPGPWYLFAMSKDGVPSVARTVMVTAS